MSFTESDEFFSSFLSKQCSINENDSKFPSNLVHHTNEKLSHVTFNSEHIGKVIRFRSQ